MSQDFTSYPGKTSKGREDRIAAAQQERRRRGARTGATLLAGAALVGLGVKALPDGGFNLNDPGTHDHSITQTGDAAPGIDRNVTLEVDQNGMPYVPVEPDHK